MKPKIWNPAPVTQPGGIIQVATPLQLHTAKCLSLARKQAHDHCRKTTEDLGVEGNDRADFAGLLGELLVIHALESDGQQPTDYALLAERAQIGPDFRLDCHAYDIKAIPFGSQYLCVNERQRTDPRHGVDYILPVYFVGSNAAQILRPISVASVGRWELRQGHSPYRSVHVSTLAPLEMWEELPGATLTGETEARL